MTAKKPKLKPERLKQVRTLNEVIEFLTDELDWPIEAGDLEDATFDWEPEEIGLQNEQVPHLARLRQLRPLAVNQPWGIFFLEFDGPRLPLTVLRRLLDKLVTKKRASSGSLRTWELEDLLFIVTTSSGDTVELHFVAMFDQDNQAAEIRSIPWRPAQSPPQHLRRVVTELLPHLAWPDDDSAIDSWRDEWRTAFKLRHGDAIASAARLAERMAATAQALRAEIVDALSKESKTGPFTRLMADVRTQLVGTVTPDSFADMCAQTLVYGVLSSRITDPESFGATPTLSSVPLSTPFLAAFFEEVHDQAIILDIDDIGLEQLVADLRVTNVEAILDQFGSTAFGGDPVIHFYEEFLKSYDSKMRADAGAFYTPQPVVAAMVRIVDSLLRERFGLSAGLADPATWEKVAELNGFEVPQGVDGDSRFISMMDPATGTGTFLVEWLRQARDSFIDGSPAAEWPDHARDVVLPGMHAFELMLAPYAIAHLKFALELHNEGIEGAATTILLTDTLDYSAHDEGLFDNDPVSNEGDRAAKLKTDARFTVVIGNPPYDREQRATDDKSKRKGGVARYGASGIPALMDSVLEPLKAAGMGQHAKNAYNDYVYFWTWAIWQAAIKQRGPGVVAFITASSFIDGVSLGGLRKHLRDAFDEVWIVDLGGEGRGARTDENVFAIRTPVAITFGVRNGEPSPGCEVRYLRIEGSREDKLSHLGELDLTDLNAESMWVDGMELDRLTPSGGTAYTEWPEITKLMPWIHSGSQVKRLWPIGPTKSLLERRWAEFLAATPSYRRELLKETRDRKTTSRVSGLLDDVNLSPLSSRHADDKCEGFERYGYRSFDRQWVIADNRVADYPRPPLWQARGSHQVFLATLTSTKLGYGPVVTATPYVPDLDFFSGRGAKNVIPLFRDASGQRPNVTAGLLDELTSVLGQPIEPEHLLAYVYGLTATAAFAERFTNELGEAAGPIRIPVTADRMLFNEVVTLGKELLWLHTWGERFTKGDSIPSPTAQEISPVRHYPEDFSWNAFDEVLSLGDGQFGPISQEVWEFEVSGLKVLQSWLGYRMRNGKGRKSSDLDEIRPERWTFSNELLTMLAILEGTIERTPRAAQLLERVVESPLIAADSLPTPTEAERKPPK